jgi:Raf kinase inhibitor-like YbhB/YbcL family protein
MKSFAALALASGMMWSNCSFAMDLTSADIRDGQPLPKAQVGRTCGGSNIAPSLSWSGAPKEAKSYAITLYDPDAKPNGWWHWIAFNIPAATTSLPKGGKLPKGAITATNNYLAKSYDGACPPPGSGVHHYQFTVWALDSATLPYDSTANGNAIGPWFMLHGVAKARITALYQR